MPGGSFYHKLGYMIPPGILIPWPGTNASIPAGWTRETSLDGRFVKMVPTATNPGGTGGSGSHDHPFPTHTHSGAAHTHAGGTVSSSVGGAGAGTAFGAVTSMMGHGHSGATSSSVAAATSGSNSSPTNYDAISDNPPYFEVIFIRSDGSQRNIPNTAIMLWNTASPPTNWRACDGASGAPDLRNRFMRGASAAANGGGTGGAIDAHGHVASHTHPSGGTHTHTPYLSNGSYNGDTGYTGSLQRENTSHQHDDLFTAAGDASGTAAPTFNSATGANANADGQPPWKKLFAIQSNAVNPLVAGLIGMWLGTLAAIPPRWNLCNGTSGTPNELDKFVKAVNTTGEIGNTGGAATHTHAAGASHAHGQTAHSHTWSGKSAVANDTTSLGHFFNDGPDGTAFNRNSGHWHNMSGSTNTDGAVTSGGTTVDATANSTNAPLYTEVAYIQFAG